MSTTTAIVARVAVGAAVLFAAPAAFAQSAVPAPSSGAFAVSARLVSAGSVTGLPPVALAQGSLPGAYDKKVQLAAFGKDVAIAANGKQIGTLTITAGSMKSEAVSAGYGLDNLSVAANAALGSVQITLSLYPPLPVILAPAPLLMLNATQVTASAADSVVVPQPGKVSATAGFGALTLSGSLLAGQMLTTSGTPAANTVLFSNDAVTVTLNRQLTGGVISCDLLCTFSPVGITGDAIAIELNHLKVFGDDVSGEILVAQTQAAIP